MVGMTAVPDPRRIVLLGFDRFQALDLVGPAEVFSMASRLQQGAYSIEVVAARNSEISSSSGLRLRPDRSLGACRGPIDTLVVVGGEGVPDAMQDRGTLSWIAKAASRSRRVTSVCNGAFLLARAGLLDGRRATTHWSACETLQRRYPEVDVEPDAIFVKDGDVYSSAGVTAGMDLEPRARRGGPRPPRGARGGALARAVPQTAGRSVAVQRPAFRSDRRAGAAA